MRSFARVLLCAACVFSLAAAPVAFADDEDDAPSARQSAKEKREARRNKEAAQPKGNFGKEMTALGEAAAMLAGVNDEASAKEAADKLCKKFGHLPPLVGGTESQLELLAKAQNKVNDQMERLMATSYFAPSGLQEAWTLMTDHFSRRSAQKRRRR